jgi:hypothetical protein
MHGIHANMTGVYWWQNMVNVTIYIAYMDPMDPMGMDIH